ncbi:YlxR family protein [Phormidium tenue FACHB-886]|nr:YlxR family protein [Phormidium tenue FACHB-886]
MSSNYRRCVSCRRVAPKTDFWRVVRVFPTRTIQLDQGMGRSAYLCPTVDCLQLAQKKDRLGRSLKSPVSKDTYQTLWQRLSILDKANLESLKQAQE